MVSSYYGFNFGSESMMLGLALIMVVLIAVTQPRVTMMYKVNAYGFLLSAITIIVHQMVLYQAYVRPVFNPVYFNLSYGIYCLLYSFILVTIFGYITLLSYRKRTNIRLANKILFIHWMVFLLIEIYPLIMGKLYVFDETGAFQFTNWQYTINQAGVLCAIVSFLTTFLGRKEVSKIVSAGLLVFAPVEIIILIAEPFFKKTYFTSYTYVLSFMVFYILFHCATYDDVVGCQNADALKTQVDNAIKRGQKYVLINTYFPQMQKREFGDVRSSIDYVSSEKCRKIERLMPWIRLYSSSIYNYYLFTTVKSDAEAEKIIDGLNSILREPMRFGENNYVVYSKQTIIRENDCLKSYKHVSSMMGYLRERMSSNMEHECIIATEKDYENFVIYYKVLQALLDIRYNHSIDDERVLCYIQPIHNIESNAFLTGESLMRMKIDDQLIFPDQFIGVAESNDCIHSLTRIMLNKVCQKIKYLEDNNYEFDAITVNCSTMELEDWDLHQELFDIISVNHIQPNHIRLEITESTSISNYDSILHNMKKLNEKGITFYLDDFGTGYSNLERIMNYPFKTIKFDKSILYNAISSPKADEMMRMLVDFFMKNGLTTVVEGVEDMEQYEYCKEVGFNYIQGYLFSKPIPIDGVTEFFKKN